MDRIRKFDFRLLEIFHCFSKIYAQTKFKTSEVFNSSLIQRNYKYLVNI